MGLDAGENLAMDYFIKEDIMLIQVLGLINIRLDFNKISAEQR